MVAPLFAIPLTLGVVGTANWLAGAVRGEGTTPLGMFWEGTKEEAAELKDAAIDEATDILTDIVEEAAEIIVPVTVGAAEALYDEVAAALKERVSGNEDSVVMWVMLSMMAVTVLLFVWRTPGRRSQMV